MPRNAEMIPIQIWLNPEHQRMLEDMKVASTRNTSDMIRHCLVQEWSRMQINLPKPSPQAEAEAAGKSYAEYFHGVKPQND